MGSRTKYYTDLQVNNMFTPDDNLWGSELARIAALSGSMSARDILPTVINDANMFYNEAVFDKMGITADVELSTARLTEDGIKEYIQTNIDPDISKVDEWGYSGVDATILQVYDALIDLYPQDTSLEPDEMYQIIDGVKYSLEYYPFIIEDKAYYISTATTDDKKVPNTYFQIYYYVTMTPVEEGDDIDVSIPTDNRSVAVIDYTRTDGTSNHIFIFDGEVKGSAYLFKAMIIPFYKNFNPVPDSRELDFIYGRFGLAGKDKDGDSLKESLANNADMKHCFISYSLSRDNDKFGKWVEYIYGSNDPGEVCVPQSHFDCFDTTISRVDIKGEYDIYYRLESGYYNPSDGSAMEGGYKITIERETKDADSGQYYIIPVDFLQKQKLPDKFNAYKEMFNMFMYAEKKVKVKWYQSLFFRFLFAIIAFVFVGPAALVAMAVNQVLQVIDPRLAAIIGVVLGVLNFNPAAALQSTFKVLDSLLKAFSAFSQYAFETSLKAITGEIEYLTKEIKDMQEALADMWHKGLYMPLDTQDMISENMYNCGDDFIELSYNMPELAIAQLESMTDPNSKLV
jgi:hypothetical protein